MFPQKCVTFSDGLVASKQEQNWGCYQAEPLTALQNNRYPGGAKVWYLVE